MRVTSLRPAVVEHTEFLWSRHVEVPTVPGCYVLAAFDMTVLYVGLASKNLAGRMGNHLEDDLKRKGWAGKIPYWFYYLRLPAAGVRTLERGWLNQSILEDGALPPLNRVHSPI